MVSKEAQNRNIKRLIVQSIDPVTATDSLILAKQREAVSVLIKYLRLDSIRYVLDITEKEAIELGVSPFIFKRLISQLEVENKLISEAIASGKNVKIPDPQAQLKKYNNEQLRRTSKSYSRIEKLRKANAQNPSGRITTSGQEEGIAAFVVPDRTSSVTFVCASNGGALVYSFTCTVSAFGVTNSDTAWSAGICNAVINLPIVVSGAGIVAGLAFRTSCPGGGYAIWTAN